MISLTVNGKLYNVDVAPDMPLLWVIRDVIGLTGTKFGCGLSQCGACTVHLDGNAVRSCGTPASVAAGKKVTTIEGLSANSSHALQIAWIAEQVPQCGYCQSGQIMTAAALLAKTPKPTDAGVEHERTALPSRCTVQAPHCERPQPNFVPVRPMTSRITHSKGMSAGTSTL